jgi:hypothetical protein
MRSKIQHFKRNKYFTKPTKQTIHSSHMSMGTKPSICNRSSSVHAGSANANSIGRWVNFNSQTGHQPPRLFSKRSLFLGTLLIAVLTHFTQLSAKSDDTVTTWAPPIEPPGSVVVTTQKVDNLPKTTAQQFTQATVADDGNQNVGSTPNHAQATEDALRLALAQWSRAWSQQDMARYLSMYADNFKAPNGISREAWARQRTQRITSKQQIEHSISNLDIDLRAITATVRFTQNYQDERLKQTDRKTMFWAFKDGRWQITLETTN